MTDKIVVLSTCGSANESERIATRLIDEKLAACVTVIPQVRSYYRWQGKVENSAEFLLLIKTSRELLDNMRGVLEAAHSYELPEAIALPIIAGSPNYLEWMNSELSDVRDV